MATLTAALARAEARLEAQPPPPADTGLSSALVSMMQALTEQQSKRGEVQARLIDALFERASKAALSATAAEMGRRGNAARNKKEKAITARDAYISEVCQACAECESRLFNKPSRDPSDLSRHLTEMHDSSILPAARAVLSGQMEIGFNGKPASSV